MVLLRLLAFKPAAGAAAEKKTLKSGAEAPVAPPMAVAPAPAALPGPVPPRASTQTPAVAPVASTPTPAVPLVVRPVSPPAPIAAPVLPQTAAVPQVRSVPSPDELVPLDESYDVPWVEEPDEAPVDEGVVTSRRVVPVPVRDPGPSSRLDRLRDPAEAAPVREPVRSAEGDFWFDAVTQLVRAEAVTALVRELALQSQLVARDAGQWVLRVERESLKQGNAPDRLAMALQTLGHAVRLVVEIGPVDDSASMRQAADAARRQREAEQIIRDDPFVQQMMRDFGGKIVPGTLKA